jgi:hypothetical protein
MHPLYFTGRARLAAKQILDHTSLGGRLADDSADGEGLLSIFPYPEVVDSLSTGEQTLFGILESLAGHDTANLYKLYVETDPDTAWCAWWALGVLLDRVVPMDPADFVGLRDVVRS